MRAHTDLVGAPGIKHVAGLDRPPQRMNAVAKISAWHYEPRPQPEPWRSAGLETIEVRAHPVFQNDM
jgi:hypothetical protein